MAETRYNSVRSSIISGELSAEHSLCKRLHVAAAGDSIPLQQSDGGTVSGLTTKGNDMRSRVSVLMLTAILGLGFAACSKKDQTQNQPATTDNSANQTAQQMAPAQQQPQVAPGQQQPQQPMAQAPAQQQQQQQQMAPAPEPPPPPPPLVVPAGTHIVVRMGNSLNTKTTSTGEAFTGSLANAVAVHGDVAIPAGARVTGTVADSKSPGRFKGAGVLSITLTSINVRGVPMNVATSTYTQTVKGKGKRTAVAVGGGTGAGALIGGLAGGGKGALIGGLVGAGAGTAGAAFTGNKELEIPAESVVPFRLANKITVNRVEKNAQGQMNQSQ
jgi:hypothetical protein